MKNNGKVQGSQEQVLSVEILGDRVLVRTNIVVAVKENFKGWEYDEVEYTKDEYISLIAEQNNRTNNKLLETQATLANLQEQMLLNNGGM